MANTGKNLGSLIPVYFFITLGAFLAAFSLEVFFTPNRLIDGGIVGIGMILAKIFGYQYLAYFVLILNAPFAYLAYKHIGKAFVVHMLYALVAFAISLLAFHYWLPWRFHGEMLEVVVIGGAILGIGLGLIIRYGGCTDGTEILGIICNRQLGFTVGQVVLVCNVFIFGAAGLVFQDWHPPLLSLIAYMVAIKVMDTVIVGLDETKSVIIISRLSKEIADEIMHDLGLGLTIMYGRGGFSGEDCDILYVIAERLQLADLKELVHQKDPNAFIAIENLHEVANGNQDVMPMQKSNMKKLVSKVFKFGS